MVPPPQVPLKPFGEATTIPAGRVSLKAMPFSVAVVFGFVMLTVRVTVALSAILGEPKAMPRVGGATTVNEMFDVVLDPPSVEDTATLLFFTPAVLPVTLIDGAGI